MKYKWQNSRANRGKNNPYWKGGKIKTSNGYIWIYAPDNPMSNKCHPEGYVLEHRLIMSQAVGRYLIKNEVVHHINGIRDDNRIENLFLTKNGKHIAQHNHKRIWAKSSIKKAQQNSILRERDKMGRFS